MWLPTGLRTQQQPSSSAGECLVSISCPLKLGCRAHCFLRKCQRPWAFLLTSPATGLAASLLCCSNGTFLPSAFIMGLQPGSSLDAEVRCCCK